MGEGIRSRKWAIWAVGAALLLACSSPPPPPPDSAEARATYVIGAGDLLGIRVWKNPELSVDVPVRPDGMLSVPLIGDLQAQGMTAEDLSTLIAHELNEYITNADVTVLVLKTGSKRVFVIGAVLRSGPVPLLTDLHVVDAIAQSGGFGAFADRSHVRIIRKTPKGEVTYRFNYDAYVAGKAPGTNVQLQAGDTIVVPD